MTEVIRYGSKVSQHIAGWAEDRLKKYMRAAGITSVLISSARRTPYDQARIMYDDVQNRGIDKTRAMYGASGNKVLDFYQAALPRDVNIAAMEAAVIAVGPTNVSRHLAPASQSETFDVEPSSVEEDKQQAFLDALALGKSYGEVRELLFPPKDPAYHIEFVPGAPDHEIAVAPRSTGTKTVVALLLTAGLAWMLTRS